MEADIHGYYVKSLIQKRKNKILLGQNPPGPLLGPLMGGSRFQMFQKGPCRRVDFRGLGPSCYKSRLKN